MAPSDHVNLNHKSFNWVQQCDLLNFIRKMEFTNVSATMKVISGLVLWHSNITI